MIIGNGDIASVLKPVDRHDRLFFASGVSNSKETRREEYEREKFLFLEQPIDKHFIYFSSLSVFYASTAYTKHKKNMEQMVRNRYWQWTIVRIGNITWGNNPHTIINFIRNKINNGEKFEVRDEYRYVINKDEFLHWLGLIPSWNTEMNITGRRMLVKDIVKEYCQIETNGVYANQ
jgi:hypothetical protein